MIEGKRWLDDAFACAGEADERTRALALTGRGLLDFLAGVRDTDDDLEAALEIFRRHDDVESMALAYSFYAEQPNARGDRDEARRRRLVLLDFYGESPQDPFAVAARAYSLGKLALMDGDLAAAEVHYRAAAEGFARIDRPVMLSMTLDVVADFDERAGDHAAAVRALDEAIATNEACGLRGFTGSLLARLGWALLHVGDLARAEAVVRTCARRRQPAAQHAGDVPRPHRARRPAPSPRPTTTLRPRRHARRWSSTGRAIPAGSRTASTPRTSSGSRPPRATSCSPSSPPNGDEPEQAAVLLGRAERLLADAGREVPAFQHDDQDRARRAAIAALGPDGFAALFERGRHDAPLTSTFSASAALVQRAPGWCW